jgi:membrane fusion protein, adhesin transport system
MLNISNNSIKSELVEQELNSMQALQSPPSARFVYRWVAGICFILLLVMFLPWQQNINGKGYVSTLRPQDRPQSIQNAVAGQIQQWAVREGDFVHKGDTILVVSEIKDDYFDPKILERTQEQIIAKNDGVGGYKAKIDALNQHITALQQGLKFSLEKANNKYKQARLKVRSDSADLIAISKNFIIAQDRMARGEDLWKSGAISLTDLETRRLKFQEDNAKVISQEQKLNIARNELINTRIELNSVQAEYEKDIAKANADRSSAVSSLAEGRGEVSKLENKYENIRIRRSLYVIRAPQAGYVVKTLKAGIGETIKEGESVATLQPKISEIAVELYIKTMDLALVKTGEHVRLEFDGWPALQFSGWPGASVGTFGGQVVVIDRISSKNGEYRLLITPDGIGQEQSNWPNELRLGSGVNGFVMLKDVPIWWEIWRQLNGFPPDYLDDIQTDEVKKSK